MVSGLIIARNEYAKLIQLSGVDGGIYNKKTALVGPFNQKPTIMK
jgi:hypothetical protein